MLTRISFALVLVVVVGCDKGKDKNEDDEGVRVSPTGVEAPGVKVTRPSPSGK